MIHELNYKMVESVVGGTNDKDNNEPNVPQPTNGPDRIQQNPLLNAPRKRNQYRRIPREKIAGVARVLNFDNCE